MTDRRYAYAAGATAWLGVLLLSPAWLTLLTIAALLAWVLRGIWAALATAAVVAALVVAAAHASSKPSRPAWMSQFAWAVGTCETPHPGEQWPHFDHRSGDLEGFVGWRHYTWLMDRYAGMPEHAYQATPREQNRVAARSFAKHRYFGCIANGGYRVWMASS